MVHGQRVLECGPISQSLAILGLHYSGASTGSFGRKRTQCLYGLENSPLTFSASFILKASADSHSGV